MENSIFCFSLKSWLLGYIILKWLPIGQILSSGMPGMAHMAGNEPNFDISSKKYDVQKTVPQKYKTAWALGHKGFEGSC